MKPKVIAIAGPTASGKTKMAIDLAKQIDGEVISADSRYVYKGFNIASAKPTLEEQDGIPHHLIDIVEPEVDYSVADFYDNAREKIYEIINRGKTPIIAGGTGLYFKVLLETYDLPRVEANPKLRAELDLRDKEDLLTEEEYDKYRVQDLFFTTEEGVEQAVRMMFADENVYLEDEDAVGFMKYYKENHDFMVFEDVDQGGDHGRDVILAVDERDAGDGIQRIINEMRVDL